MANESEQYGADLYGQTVYGGAATATESPTITATTTTVSPSETSDADGRSTAILGVAYTTTDDGNLTETSDATFVHLIANTDAGTGIESPSFAGSTTVASEPSTTAIEVPTQQTTQLFGATGTTTGDAVAIGSLAGITTVVLPVGIAQAVVTDTELAEAAVIEAADAAQSEVVTLPINGSLEPISASTATANASADQSTPTVYVPGDQTTALADLTTVSGITTPTTGHTTGVSESPTLLPVTLQSAIGATTANATSSATLPPVFDPGDEGVATEFGTVAQPKPAPEILTAEWIATEGPTITDGFNSPVVSAYTIADGVADPVLPVRYDSADHTDAYVTGAQTSPPLWDVADYGIATNSAIQRTGETMFTSDVGVASPSIGVLKATGSNSIDRTITTLYPNTLSIGVGIYTDSQPTASATVTGSFGLLQDIDEFGFESIDVAPISITGTPTIDAEPIATESGSSSATSTMLSVPTTTGATSTIEQPITLLGSIDDYTYLLGSATQTTNATVKLTPHLQTSVFATQSIEFVPTIGDVGIGYNTASQTSHIEFRNSPFAPVGESLEVTSPRTVHLDGEAGVSTDDIALHRPITPFAVDDSSADESGTTTVANSIYNTDSAPITETAPLTSGPQYSAVSIAGGTERTSMLSSVDTSTIIQSDGSVLESISNTFAPQYSTSETAPITAVSSVHFGTQFADPDRAIGSDSPTIGITRTADLAGDLAIGTDTPTIEQLIDIDLSAPRADITESPRLNRGLSASATSSADAVGATTVTFPPLYDVTPEATAFGSVASIDIADSVTIDYDTFVEATPTVYGTHSETLSISTSASETYTDPIGVTTDASSYTHASGRAIQQTTTDVAVSGRVPSLERAVSITDAFSDSIGLENTPERQLMTDTNANDIDLTDGAELVFSTEHDREVVITNADHDLWTE